jgi:oxygen-independent coproporphyrinogen III oxidase
VREDIEPIRHLYIHVPFCLSKCGYCSFYSKEPTASEIEEYCRLLLKEITYYKTNYKLVLETVYFGGGTPSLLFPEQIENILKQLTFAEKSEITIEANPGDVDNARATGWLKAGVNRISIGLQSMRTEELQLLGRRHNVEDNYKAISILRESGFANISFDMIYGLPYQKVEDVEYSLKEYMKLSPEHISTYCLSLADDCGMAAYRDKLPEDEIVSDMYHLIRNVLLQNGWQQYELSNFCRDNLVSIHNSAYWKNREYAACGPSACGYLSKVRYQNYADMQRWKRQILDNEYLPNSEIIDESIREKEFIILALRTNDGFKLKDFARLFKIDFKQKYSEKLVKFQKLKLLEEKNGNIRLLPEAYFISNVVLREFV